MQTIAFGLRGIEIGEHDDRICLEYQKQVAKRFNVPPPLCPYKTNKKGIEKLMKKKQLLHRLQWGQLLTKEREGESSTSGTSPVRTLHNTKYTNTQRAKRTKYTAEEYLAWW